MNKTFTSAAGNIGSLGYLSLLLCSSVNAALVADNGFGTGRMPLDADYNTETPLQIVNGLSGGSTIQIDGVFKAPTSSAEIASPVGILGGSRSGGSNVFEWDMTGTGALTGFSRSINILLSTGVESDPGLGSVGFEVHSAPRIAFAPVQVFNTDLFRLFGQITGDPDFDLLRIVAGTDFGLSSPGMTSFSQSGGGWEAGSYYDMTYRIDFVGRAGGALAGMSGSTTGVARISVGTVVPEPTTAMLMLTATAVGIFHRRRLR